MAKIDWGSVEGFREDMTAEEKVEFMSNYELPEPDPSAAPAEEVRDAKPRTDMISKKQFDKVSSELAAAKRQLRSRMTEEEAKEEERRTAEEALRIELEELRREKTVSGYKAEHLAQGYDDRSAADAAEALASGDMENYFSIVRRQAQIAAKAMRAQILKDTPVPPAGNEADADSAKAKRDSDTLRHWMGI